MKNNKFHFMAMIFFIGIVFLMFLNKTTVMSIEAATVPTTSDVYAVAPKGVKLKDFVTAPQYYKNTATNVTNGFQSSNTFYLVGDQGNKYSNQSDIIQLLNKTSTRTTQIGSFWGTIKDSDGARTYNYFDLNKDQELSAWIYNGDSDDSNSVNDGFAFVLQTDPNGTQAISRSKGTPVGGETLGVWGGGSVNNALLSSPMATGDPIQNSFALEFDRILNNTAGSLLNPVNDYMDFDDFTDSTAVFGTKQILERHISWGYPGDPSMYFSKNVTLGGDYYYMGHRRKIHNNVYMSGYAPYNVTTDPKLAWHHLKIKYTASTGNLSYAFNDEYLDGTPRPSNTSETDTYTIDKTKFTNNRVYWGFTAATGSPKSKGQDLGIVMEKMPAVVDITPSVLLTDVTKKTTSANNNIVAATDGDDLTLTYTLKYVGGISSSGDIQATIALPKNIDYAGDSSGNIGTITYKDTDGSTIKKTVNKSEIKDITITIPGKDYNTPPTYQTSKGIVVTIPALANIGDIGQVEISGKAQAPVSAAITTTTVAAAHANLTSDNYVGDVMSPVFTVNNEKLQITNSNSLNQELTPDDTVHFKGNATYAMGTKFDGKNLTANVKVYDQAGKSINADMIGDIPVASGATTGTFDIPYDLKSLDGGQTYTFKVTLTDSANRVSNELVYTVKVADNKQLVIAKKNYLNYSVVEKSSDISLNTALSYDNGSDVKPADITTYIQVDDDTLVSGTLDETQAAASVSNSIKILGNTLSLGTHKIKLYATDGKKTSNTLEYDFKVIEHGIVLTPDQETIEVRNNDPVDLGWNVKYSSEDDDNTEHSGKFYKTELKVKNEGDSDYRDFYFQKNNDFSENVNASIGVDSDGNFDFNVNPIKYTRSTVVNSNYLDQLKEGRNEIKFQVSSDGMTSEEKTVIINVPKLTPILTSPLKTVYATGTGSNLNIPIKYEYKEDSTYTTKVGQIPIVVTADNGNSISLIAKQATIVDGPPLTFDNNAPIKALNLTAAGSPYTLHLSTFDPYDRHGVDYDLTLEFVTKILKLEVSKQSSFRDINFRDQKDDYITRQGNWKIAVDSLGAKWNLQAQSAGLFNEKDSSYSEPLVFLNKDDEETALASNPVIAQRTQAVTNQDLVEDITANWDDDDGILLKNNMPNLSGEYKGQIQWTLTEAP